MLYLYHVNVFKYYELAGILTIGRTTGDIVVADDGRMSGKHAKLTTSEVDGTIVIYVEDLESKNRTILNRMEVTPGEKIKARLNSLLETGGQQFIITQNPNLSIQEINAFLEAFNNKPIIKIEAVNSKTAMETAEMASPPAPRIERPVNELGLREEKVTQAKDDLAELDLSYSKELKKIEKMKEELVLTTKSKREVLINNIISFQKELDEYKVEYQKLKEEVELKKKKLINLKDLPANLDEVETEIDSDGPDDKN